MSVTAATSYTYQLPCQVLKNTTSPHSYPHVSNTLTTSTLTNAAQVVGLYSVVSKGQADSGIFLIKPKSNLCPLYADVAIWKYNGSTERDLTVFRGLQGQIQLPGSLGREGWTGPKEKLGQRHGTKENKQQETEGAGTNSEDHDGQRNASEKPE